MGASTWQAMASIKAADRLQRELKNLQKNPLPDVHACPDPNDILSWHYVIEGSDDGEYKDGVYHGTIQFPAEYPFKPPSLRMHTPSGRFQPGQTICLSISNFHPESWNPAWNVSTILLGLQSFFYSDEHAVGVCNLSTKQRKTYARTSMEYNMCNRMFVDLFPHIVAKYKGRTVLPVGQVAQQQPVSQQQQLSRKRNAYNAYIQDDKDQYETNICRLNRHHVQNSSAGASIEASRQYDHGDTSLICAARKGEVQKVKELLLAGTDIMAQNDDGMNALMEAAKLGKLDVCKEILIGMEGSPELETVLQSQDNTGKTALIRAARREFPELLKLLLKYGSDPNAQDLMGMSALMISASLGRFGNCLALLRLGADWHLTDVKGMNAEAHASKNGFSILGIIERVKGETLETSLEKHHQTEEIDLTVD